MAQPPELLEKCTLAWHPVDELHGAAPRPRMSHACVAVGDTLLFLFGESGKDNERTFFNNIAAFDTNTLTWTNPYAPMGAEGLDLARGDHSALLFQDDSLVIFGGRNRDAYFNSVVMTRYVNVSSAVRVQAAEMKGTPEAELIQTFVTPVCQGAPPAPRRGHTANNLNDAQMLVFGGQGAAGELFGDTFFLDVETMKWRALPARASAPLPRVFHRTIVDPSGCVLLHGGRGVSSVFDDMWVFDPRSEQWMALPSRGPHPGPRLGHSLSLFGDQGSNVLLWGGCTEAYEYCNTGYCFDGRNQMWMAAAPSGTAPCPRSFHSAQLVGRNLWVFGGWAGFRTCTGLWRAGIGSQQVPRAQLVAGDLQALRPGDSSPPTGDVTSISYSVPRAAGALQSAMRAHHITFGVTPYHRQGDRLPITAVRLYSGRETQVVAPTPEFFPEAFGRLSSSALLLVPPSPGGSPEHAALDRMIAALLGNWERYLPTVPELEDYLVRVRDVFAGQPSLVTVDPPAKIFGDIHGQMRDLVKFFTMCGNPCTDVNNYVFLGDYVDRGDHSLAVVCLLFFLKLRYGPRFTLLRGNHELRAVNEVNGFKDECLRRYGATQGVRVWMMFNEVFEHMPAAALVGRTIFCVHGGLCPELRQLKDAYSIARPSVVNPQVPADKLFYNMLWSDPSESDEDQDKFRENSTRGAGYLFNAAAVAEFCATNAVKLIVRGHEAAVEGFFYFASGKLLTIFSATNYCGEHNNCGAMLHVDSQLTTVLEVIRPDAATDTAVASPPSVRAAPSAPCVPLCPPCPCLACCVLTRSDSPAQGASCR